jgi:hypothetical protein
MHAIRAALSPRNTGWAAPFSHFERRLMVPPVHELALAAAFGVAMVAAIVR